MPRTGGSRYAARLRPISPAVAARFARYATRFSIPWLAAADRRVRRRGQTGLPNLLVLAVMCYTYGMADSPEQQGRNQLPAGRRSDLGAHLDRVGGATVHELAERYGVSIDTIRRDLDQLHDAGRVVRTHGGAVSVAVHNRTDRGMSVRVHLQAAEKEAIAAIAASLVEDGSVLIINAGTTALALARALQ